MRQSQNRMNFMIYLWMYNLLHFAYEVLFTNRKKNSLLVSTGRSTKYKRFSQYLTDNVSIFAFMNCFKGFYCQCFCAIYQIQCIYTFQEIVSILFMKLSTINIYYPYSSLIYACILLSTVGLCWRSTCTSPVRRWTRTTDFVKNGIFFIYIYIIYKQI